MRASWIPLVAALSADAVAAPATPAASPPAEIVAGRARAWERIAGRAVPLRTHAEAALDPVGAAALADGAAAWVVLRDGVLVGEGYASGVGPETRFPLGDATDGLLAMLVGVAIADGVLRPEDAVPRHLPEWSDERRQALTVLDLLHGAAGLAPDATTGSPDGAFTIAAAAPKTARWRLAHDRDLVPALLSIRAGRAPGRAYMDDDAVPQALALVLERATGTRWVDLLEARLWWPLGASEAWVPLDHRRGEGLAFVGPYVTARDAARIGQLLLDDGRIGDTALLPPGWAARLRVPSPQIGDHGLGVWLADRGPGASQASKRSAPFDDPELFWLAGADGQRVYVSPRERIVVARFGTATVDDAQLPNGAARALGAS